MNKVTSLDAAAITAILTEFDIMQKVDSAYAL